MKGWPPGSNTSLWLLLWLLWTRLAVLMRRCGACRERRLLLLLQLLSVLLSSSHIGVQSCALLLILMSRLVALPRPLVSLRVLMWLAALWLKGNSVRVEEGLLLLVMLLVVLVCVASLKALLVPMLLGSLLLLSVLAPLLLSHIKVSSVLLSKSSPLWL